jgi:hypothetical protein
MRVRVVTTITATPRERLLLRNPEHYHPGPSVALRLTHMRRAPSSLTTPFANRTTGISCAFATGSSPPHTPGRSSRRAPATGSSRPHGR